MQVDKCLIVIGAQAYSPVNGLRMARTCHAKLPDSVRERPDARLGGKCSMQMQNGLHRDYMHRHLCFQLGIIAAIQVQRHRIFFTSPQRVQQIVRAQRSSPNSALYL